MKTLLNLLPEEKKTALQRRIRSRFLLWQLMLLFLLEVFYASVLFGVFFVLSFQLQTLQESSSAGMLTSASQEEKLREYESKFRGANEAVEVIGRIENEHLSFGSVFRLLEELLPAGIVLESLSTDDYSVRLVGRASTREDLLALDDHLKQSNCLEEVNVPISSLFSQTEVDFQLEFMVKRECLRERARI